MSSNILLINPEISNSSQNQKIKAVTYATFPSSLAVLVSCLEKEGITGVQVEDDQIKPISDHDLEQCVNQLNAPKIIGMSVLTLNSGRAYELAEKIKQIDPETTVVLGGIHPTVVPEECLRKKGVDVVVRGEGELTFIEFVQKVLGNEDYTGIKGISYIKNAEPVHNPDRELIVDLDEIPPMPYHLFEKDLEKYSSFATVVGTRGCPYQCTFCSSRSISGKRYRYHSVERIVSECEILIRKYKQTAIHFLDDNMAVKKKRFFQMCDAIIEKGLHKEAFFHGSMRGDNATTEVLQKAKQANFKIIYYGMETGIERLMKIVDKGETVQDVVDAIKRGHDVGLEIGTTIIFGLPTETRKDRYDTMKLIRKLSLLSVRYNTLSPYPGTPAYRNLYPEGKVLIKENWRNFGVQYMWESDDIPYVPDESKRLELIFDTMFANLSFYLAPKGLWRLLTSPVAGSNVIKLKKYWFLYPAEAYRMFMAFVYLISRFSSVSVRMLRGMIMDKKEKGEDTV